ncbi:carboxypeptidase A2 isoform X2 [Selaginella moellendorffii]|uniref:carboxypeptidase A2 isoform X2 n=1 Tax=Selaginella moellendorffii TaxID=88036 RepID=UPI000D1C47BC|nr:carboxypeptidase A2 isoform X2 [Selaginella moellendorffii]|eukprot:XP_024522319.1 carboxypeptidase A2 isoform X2 [Selaginella moellendorffii]
MARPGRFHSDPKFYTLLPEVLSTRVKDECGFCGYRLACSDALLRELDALVARHPSTMSLEGIQADASDGYKAEIRVVTVAGSVQASSFDDRVRIFLNFGQHGRELITSEVALRLLRILSREDKSASKKHIDRILSRTVFKIVPMENVNGRQIVENGSLCERRNGRGVDTNRNWKVNWGVKEKDYDPTEEFPGTAPFSEPETRILRDIALRFKPHLWVNVHSGMQALFMPYDHKNATPGYQAAARMSFLLQTLNALHCNGNCTVGSGGGAVGYLAHGTATDYMYDVLKVPSAFTFEIYGDVHANRDDCFRMFNPTTPGAFESVVTRWSLAFVTLAFNLSSMPSKALGRSRKVGRTLWDSTRDDAQNPIVSRELRFYLLATGLILCCVCYKLVSRLCHCSPLKSLT